MRLFVAVWPPEEVVDRLRRIERPPRSGLRWTRPEQWHITLRFLGWCAEPEPVFEAFRAVRADGCEAVMGPATARLGRGVLQVPVAGVDTVAAAVVAATAGVGRPPEDRPFVGHLTLARAERPALIADLVGTPLAGRWPVDELTLVSSVTGRAGSRYTVVERLPLER